MTLNNLHAALCSASIPVAHRSFPGITQPPYAVYYQSKSDPIASDKATVGRWATYRVELYTIGKDTVTEAAVESALNTVTTEFWKEEVGVIDGDLLMITYEFEGVE